MRILLATFLGLTAFLATASAEQSTIEVVVRTANEPVQVAGLLIGGQSTRTKHDVTYRTAVDGSLIVSVPFSAADVGKDTMASALVRDQSGAIHYGEMRPLFIPALRQSFLSLPQCQDGISIAPAFREEVYSNEGTLRNLIDIRKAQRDVAQLKLAQELQGDLLEKVTRLEQVFGLSNDQPLSATMPPVLLQDRLNRVLVALKNYQGNK